MVLRRSKGVSLAITTAVAAVLMACGPSAQGQGYACVGPNNQVVASQYCSTGGASYFWFYPSVGYYHPLSYGSYVVVNHGYRETAVYGHSTPSRTFSSRATSVRSSYTSSARSVSGPRGTVSRGAAGSIGAGRGFGSFGG